MPAPQIPGAFWGGWLPYTRSVQASVKFLGQKRGRRSNVSGSKQRIQNSFVLDDNQVLQLKYARNIPSLCPVNQFNIYSKPPTPQQESPHRPLLKPHFPSPPRTPRTQVSGKLRGVGGRGGLGRRGLVFHPHRDVIFQSPVVGSSWILFSCQVWGAEIFAKAGIPKGLRPHESGLATSIMEGCAGVRAPAPLSPLRTS